MAKKKLVISNNHFWENWLYQITTFLETSKKWLYQITTFTRKARNWFLAKWLNQITTFT